MAEAIQAYVAHYHPLLGSLMQQKELVEAVNEQIGTNKSQTLVDSGTMVGAMIHNILGNEPIRLYRLEHFFTDKPLPLLFPWQAEVALGWLNDDRAGRVLDEVWAAGPQKLFSAVSQRVIRQYQLEVDHLHLDSTSKSFEGVYENQPDAGVPQLRRGYSKDHQPELVQLLFGVGTTREGVVVYGDVASGNTQEMVANGYWLSQVRQQLGLGDDDFLLYVADSTAVTEENLKVMRLFHQDLISRLPGRYNLHDRLLAIAPADLAEGDEVGVMGQGQEAARYLAWESEADLAGAVYRFLVLWSDKLAGQHRHTLHRQLTKEWEKVVTALAAVESQRFETEGLAQAGWTAFLTKHKTRYHQLDATLEPLAVELPYAQPGRPTVPSGPPPSVPVCGPPSPVTWLLIGKPVAIRASLSSSPACATANAFPPVPFWRSTRSSIPLNGLSALSKTPPGSGPSVSRSQNALPPSLTSCSLPP